MSPNDAVRDAIVDLLGLSNLPAASLSAGQQSSPRERWYPQIQLSLGSLPFSVREWQRPKRGESGDFLVIEALSADALIAVAADIAGHGGAVARRALYLDGWIRGWVRSQASIPRLENLVEALNAECVRTDIELAIAVGLISVEPGPGMRGEIEVLTLGYPAPVLITGPPTRTPAPQITEGVCRLGRLLGKRFVWRPEHRWRLALASDGVLQRLGAGEEAKGRSAVRLLLEQRGGRDPLATLAKALTAPADDESILFVESVQWDETWDLSVDGRDEIRRMLRALQIKASRELSPRTIERFMAALAIPIENVFVHARVDSFNVRARIEPKRVTVEIADEGIGLGDRAAAGGLTALDYLCTAHYQHRNHPKGTVIGIVVVEGSDQ